MWRLTPIQSNFANNYKCFPIEMKVDEKKVDVLYGGKIIMPSKALMYLTLLNTSYPMLFKINNPKFCVETHCGVLEFVAEPGLVYFPRWLMEKLMLEEGAVASISSVSLPKATFARFQPQSADFFDISNPKAVLENCLRSYACLTTNDEITIHYNKKIYRLLVLETKPANAVNIIECDMLVEFSPVPGIQKPEEENEETPMKVNTTSTVFVPFQGQGYRLSGKPVLPAKEAAASHSSIRGVPDHNFQVGKLTFIRK